MTLWITIEKLLLEHGFELTSVARSRHRKYENKTERIIIQMELPHVPREQPLLYKCHHCGYTKMMQYNHKFSLKCSKCQKRMQRVPLHAHEIEKLLADKKV